MAEQSEKTGGNWPIPREAVRVFRERKRERGVPVTRSIKDALEFALRPEFRRLWF